MFTVPLSLLANSVSGPIWITKTGVIIFAVEGDIINYQLNVRKGQSTDTLTFSIVSGSLSGSGLTMNSAGLISGTAASSSATLSASITVHVVDNHGVFPADQTFTINVSKLTVGMMVGVNQSSWLTFAGDPATPANVFDFGSKLTNAGAIGKFNGLYYAAYGGVGVNLTSSAGGGFWRYQCPITAIPAGTGNFPVNLVSNGSIFVLAAYNSSGGYLMSSTDGASWSLATTNTSNYKRAYCFGSSKFFAITATSVETSSDGFVWTNITPQTSDVIADLACDPTTGRLMLLTTNATSGIWMSNNFGATWTQVGFSALGVASITRSATVATAATNVAHGFVTGQSVVIAGSTIAGYDGTFAITGVPSSTSFTYTVVNTLATPATGAITVTGVPPPGGSCCAFSAVSNSFYKQSVAGKLSLSSDMVNWYVVTVAMAIPTRLFVIDANGYSIAHFSTSGLYFVASDGITASAATAVALTSTGMTGYNTKLYVLDFYTDPSVANVMFSQHGNPGTTSSFIARWTSATSPAPEFAYNGFTTSKPNNGRGMIWTTREWISPWYGAYSTDGVNWTYKNSSLLNTMIGIAYSPALSKYIGVQSGFLYTSPDLVTWTQGPQLVNASIDDLASKPDGSLSVASGYNTAVYVIPQAATSYTAISVGSQFNYRVIWNGTAFITAGSAGTIVRSTNSTTWTAITSHTTGILTGLASNFASPTAGPNIVASGRDRIVSSDGGLTFTLSASTINATDVFYSATFGKFYEVGNALVASNATAAGTVESLGRTGIIQGASR